MSFKIRPSKYRHVFGTGSRKEKCYEGIKLPRSSDGNLCAVNPKFVSVITDSAGGGSFIVIPIERTGRVSANSPKVNGHSGPVLDIKWNPFNDNIIASSSEDKTVKVWQIPDKGLVTSLSRWSLDLHGHNKRVDSIEWHPTADGILLTASLDYQCIIWNTEQAEPITVIQAHTQPIFSTSWNRDGSLFSTTSKDKMIRVIDPRSGLVAMEHPGHVGARPFRALFVGDSKLFSCGFSTLSEREYSVWDMRQMSASMKTETIDQSNGIIMPFYDYDTGVVFLAGKGDGNIRYYEMVSDASCCHYLSQYQSSYPQKGMGNMPKRGINPWKCEIMRFYKIHADKNLCEPVSMIVPRRAATFQDDVFAPTNSIHPSTTADQWISGINRDPVLVSLQDGSITGQPRTSTSKAVQQQDSGTLKSPIITTFIAVDRKSDDVSGRWARQKSFPSTPVMSPDDEPASIKNIRQLSQSVASAVGEPRRPPGDRREASSSSMDIPATGMLGNGYHGDGGKLPTARHTFSNLNGYKSSEDLDLETFQKSQISPTLPLSPRMDIEIIENAGDQKPGKAHLERFSKRYSDACDTFKSSPNLNLSPEESNANEDNLLNAFSRRKSQPLSGDDYSCDKFRELSDVWNKKVEKFWNLGNRASSRKVARLDVALNNNNCNNSSADNHGAGAIKNGDCGQAEEDYLGQDGLGCGFGHSQSFNHGGAPIALDSENLKKAYFSQVEEIKSLKEQLSLKDKRIRQLEEDLRIMREAPV